MSRARTNMASEFWFFSQLYRLGYTAYITLGNTKSVDIAVELRDKKLLTFDVKGKESFNRGTYPYLPTHDKLNEKGIYNNSHYFVFVDLRIPSTPGTKEIKLDHDPDCYIISATDLDIVAIPWKTKSGKIGGYGFDPKLLIYVKQSQHIILSDKIINRLNDDYNLNNNKIIEINNAIMTVAEFEIKYCYNK